MDKQKISQQTISSGSDVAQDLALQIKERLQITLDLDHLFKLFYMDLQSYFPINGLSFQNLDHKISLYLGDTTQDYIRQQLILDKSLLGTLRFFPETLNINTLNTYSDCLLYPLRNALQYRAALLRAAQDKITGLGNRYALETCLNQLSAHPTELALLLIDVDDFKKLNDQHGHTAGDHALANIANLLTQLPVYKDSIFRYGGDEFLILLPNMNLTEARLLAETIQSTVKKMSITLSIGVARGHTMTESFQTIFERADKALYQAKAQGKNCIVN